MDSALENETFIQFSQQHAIYSWCESQIKNLINKTTNHLNFAFDRYIYNSGNKNSDRD